MVGHWIYGSGYELQPVQQVKNCLTYLLRMRSDRFFFVFFLHLIFISFFFFNYKSFFWGLLQKDEGWLWCALPSGFYLWKHITHNCFELNENLSVSVIQMCKWHFLNVNSLCPMMVSRLKLKFSKIWNLHKHIAKKFQG